MTLFLKFNDSELNLPHPLTLLSPPCITSVWYKQNTRPLWFANNIFCSRQLELPTEKEKCSSNLAWLLWFWFNTNEDIQLFH